MNAPDIAVPLRLSRRALLATLLGVTAALSAASVLAQVSAHVLGHRSLLGLVRMFDMNREANLPAWYSTALLLGCGALAALISTAVRRRRGAGARHWALLAALLVAASADEAASIHETVGLALEGQRGAGFAWLAPWGALMICIAVALRGLVARLPRATARGLLMALATFLFGALALEAPEAVLWPGDPRDVEFGLALLGTFQDFFELLGLALLLYTLTRYASDRQCVVGISLRP